MAEDIKINGSTRMFGMPHQLLAHNDPRLSSGTDLGKTFAETMILEAPIISIKPGVSIFLPGMSDSDKAGYINQFTDVVSGINAKNELQKLMEEESDSIHWFDHKPAFNDYMIGVNMICSTMAVLFGVGNERVPWAERTTFKNYDWRYYRMGKQYESSQAIVDESADSKVNGNNSSALGKFANLLMGVAESAKNAIQNDEEYIDFYVDASSSYSESASNSTTQSALSSFTDKIESTAKELAVIGAISSSTEQYEAFMEGAASKVDDLTQSLGDAIISENNPNALFNPIGNLFKRLGSGAKQVIRGGNFVLPEHFSDSSYSRSYNFTMTLATPYGNNLARFLNIGVPMAFVLGFALPVQMSANTFKSPYLLKCFSQGWFNCSLGIADVSISKGGDVWAADGLPNEVKVDVSIKDLYSNLYLPQNMNQFIENSGMMEFLMVNCGVDITNQDIFLRLNIFVELFKGTIKDSFTSVPFRLKYSLLGKVRNRLDLLR